MARPDTSQLASLLSSARSVAILLPHTPHYDSVAAACALKIVLETTGKSITVAAPDPITVEFTHLVGVNDITTTFGNRNLIITFPEQSDFVDKVSYSVEQGQLQLVISPKPNSPDIDHKRLKFVAGNSQFDLMFFIGINELRELGDFHQKAREALPSSKAISFTIHPPRENYGHLHLHDSEVSSICELTTHILESIQLAPNEDAASNLLAGIENATDNFRSPVVTSHTFHAASILMSRGGRRHNIFQPDNLPPGSVPQAPPQSNKPNPTISSTPPASPLQPTDTQASDSAAPDWYEPKVYQGTMLQ